MERCWQICLKVHFLSLRSVELLGRVGLVDNSSSSINGNRLNVTNECLMLQETKGLRVAKLPARK